MGPAYFVIAIIGCSDGGLDCRTVATPLARYESEQACLAARGDALMASTNLDFPTLLAQCRPAKAPTANQAPRRIPPGARQG